MRALRGVAGVRRGSDRAGRYNKRRAATAAAAAVVTSEEGETSIMCEKFQGELGGWMLLGRGPRVTLDIFRCRSRCLFWGVSSGW